MTHRFKIDFNPDSTYSPFVLLFKREAWLGLAERWESIGSFQKHEEAKGHYEKIKDLPEYLP